MDEATKRGPQRQGHHQEHSRGERARPPKVNRRTQVSPIGRHTGPSRTPRMCHTAGTSFCTSPARANVAVPTIVQSAWTDGYVMQHQALTPPRSVHTPPSDRRPRQVPLALSEPPQHRGLHQDSPPRGRTSPVHTTTHVTTPRILGYTPRRHHERLKGHFPMLTPHHSSRGCNISPRDSSDVWTGHQ